MPEALSRNALLSFRWSSLHCLSNEAQQVLRDLGIARELSMGLEVSPLVKRPTSRGVRAGKSKSKQRALKKFLPFSLVNARSIPKRSNVISHHIISNDLEFLAVTETWLSSDYGDDDLLNVCPANYNAVHTPRVGKRGGGVALISDCLFLLKRLRRDFLRLLSNIWPSVSIATLPAYTLSSSTVLHLSHLDAVMVSSSRTLLISCSYCRYLLARC